MCNRVSSCLVLLGIYVFFNVLATTAIYTYCHTLSLHDALPICLRSHARGAACPSRHRTQPTSRRHVVSLGAGSERRRARARPNDHAIRRGPVGRRSEEHTSELQSLMRISYAVFCLKKKKQKQITANE